MWSSPWVSRGFVHALKYEVKSVISATLQSLSGHTYIIYAAGILPGSTLVLTAYAAS
jgi:hypothetical protein